jgi:murein DD-endopeptidase MepM/ murein hydrolase activator NlpD
LRNISLRPGESRRVEVRVGRLHTAVDVNAPSVKTYVTPVRAVVEGRVVKLFAKVEYNLKVDDNVEIKFENAKADRLP